MSNQAFLAHLLNLVTDVTQAERGMAVDTGLTILATLITSTEEVAVLRADRFVFNNLRDAMDTGGAIITNNVISDISEAPTTNTNFANLRIGVAIPVMGIGAVYVDRRVSTGVISKQTIERLSALVAHVLVNNLLDSTQPALSMLYEQLAVQ